MGLSVAILGASGYAGGELVRLVDDHDGLDLVFLGAHTQAGGVLADVHPQLPGGDRRLEPNDQVPDVDLVFLALPHGASAELGHRLAETGAKVVDLGSDFRFDTPDRYRAAYGSEHPLPDQLGRWRYGLPELIDLTGADRVASPGCYPTAVLLAITPLLAAGLIGPGPVVADCLSGVSGAGRGMSEELSFGAVDEGVRAYSVTKHRHRPEIEMGIERITGSPRQVVFTPHLIPMQRGLLATVTAPAHPDADPDELRAALERAYTSHPFVEVIDRPPQTRWVVGSNRALVSVFLDQTGMVIVLAAIDNLVKGAAGQAVQAANLIAGMPETAGLPRAGWMP